MPIEYRLNRELLDALVLDEGSSKQRKARAVPKWWLELLFAPQLSPSTENVDLLGGINTEHEVRSISKHRV